MGDLPFVARTPRQLGALFARAYNEGDAPSLGSLYLPRARVHSAWGERFTGLRGQMEQAVATMLAFGGRMAWSERTCISTGEIALCEGEWRLTGATDAEGRRFDALLVASHVLAWDEGTSGWRIEIQDARVLCARREKAG